MQFSASVIAASPVQAEALLGAHGWRYGEVYEARLSFHGAIDYGPSLVQTACKDLEQDPAQWPSVASTVVCNRMYDHFMVHGAETGRRRSYPTPSDTLR